MGAYEAALQRLYQAPVANFLAERTRLADELRAQGDKAGAAELAKRAKPVMSVWVVNQLYWQARPAFDAMLDAGARLRQGDRGAAKEYHAALADLRRRAGVLLKDAGHAASEATLRRAATTLAAIGASGGFEPDPAGALAADRDPPGFEAVATAPQPTTEEPEPPLTRRAKRRPPTPESDSARTAAERERARLRAAEAMERQQRETERARRKAERSRLQEALRAATSEARTRERTLALLEKQLGDAAKAVGDARKTVKDLERQLAQLDHAP